MDGVRMNRGINSLVDEKTEGRLEGLTNGGIHQYRDGPPDV